MAEAQPLLRAIDVHKKFGDVEVLKGIDIDVHKGEVLAIIGSSGSGKTTFLRCINLLEEFHQGEIQVDGERIGYTAGSHKRLGEAAIAAQRRLWSLQGRRRTWFCGAWFGAGFHEDGLQSGLAVAEQLGGVRRPWAVPAEAARIHVAPVREAA